MYVVVRLDRRNARVMPGKVVDYGLGNRSGAHAVFDLWGAAAGWRNLLQPAAIRQSIWF
jgi:hypothetical protein